MSPLKGVSVIVCCYNSAGRLPDTLRHLVAQQTSPNLSWEVIVVDNASSDETAQVATTILQPVQKTGFGFRVVTEMKPGLSFARSKGAREANYDVLIFCDDDNWLDPYYLQNAYVIINADPRIGALGGQSFAVSEVSLPTWFKEYESGYAVGKQGDAPGDVTKRGYLCGAGMVTRKNTYLSTMSDELPSFLTDRKGTELSSGGDNEYCQRLILLGYRLFYSEDLVFGHYLPANRLTVEYRNRLFSAFEVSSDFVYSYTEAIQFKQSTKIAKLKLILSAVQDIAVKKLTRRKVNVRSFKILYLLLGVNYKMNGNMQILKRFYDAKTQVQS